MKCSDKEWQHCQKEKLGCEGCAYNDEIKVGEYVRTKQGYIAKLQEILVNVGSYFFDRTIQKVCGDDWNAISENTLKKEIVKHSFNILDLIEVGDYVNGWKVEMKAKDCITGKWYVSEDGGDDYYDHVAFNEQIKSILTKEQFEANAYKLEE